MTRIYSILNKLYFSNYQINAALLARGQHYTSRKYASFQAAINREASYGVKEGLFSSIASSQVHVTYTRYHRSVHN